jgi:hypothetical protein
MVSRKISSTHSSAAPGNHSNVNKLADHSPDNLSPSSLNSGGSKITPVRKLSQAFARLLSFRRNSESGKQDKFSVTYHLLFIFRHLKCSNFMCEAVKQNLINFESEEEQTSDDQSSASSCARNNQRRHTGKHR